MKRPVILGVIIVALWMLVVLAIDAAVNKVYRLYLIIPIAKVPGYTFIHKGITYQVRPIKARMTIYRGKEADSCYNAIMQLDVIGE